MTKFYQKIILIGDKEVGKTSLCKRIQFDTFSSDYRPTIGIEYNMRDYQNVKQQIWDLSGDRFNNSTFLNVYMMECNAIIFVADINNEASIEALIEWNNQINSINDEYNKLPQTLVFTQCDVDPNILKERRKLIKEIAKEIKVEKNDIHYISAKEEAEKEKIKKIFDNLAKSFAIEENEIDLLQRLTSVIASLWRAAENKKNREYYDSIVDSLDVVKTLIIDWLI